MDASVPAHISSPDVDYPAAVRVELLTFADFTETSAAVARWMEIARATLLTRVLELYAPGGPEWPPDRGRDPGPFAPGAPVGAFLTVSAKAAPGERLRRPPATEAGWRRLLEMVAGGRLDFAEASVDPVDLRGNLVWAGFAEGRVVLRRAGWAGRDGDRVDALRTRPAGRGVGPDRLEADLPLAALGAPGSPGGRAAVVEAAVEGALRSGAASGYIVHVPPGLGPVGLPEDERTLRRRSRNADHFADAHLRAGEWGTLLSGPHLAALGGRGRVLAEAPVHEAIDLTAGGRELVLLLLSERLDGASAADYAALDAFLAAALLPRWRGLDIEVGSLPGERRIDAPLQPGAPAPDLSPGEVERLSRPMPAPRRLTPEELERFNREVGERLLAFYASPEAAPYLAPPPQPGASFPVEGAWVDASGQGFALVFARTLGEEERARAVAALDAWYGRWAAEGRRGGPVHFMSDPAWVDGPGEPAELRWWVDFGHAFARAVPDLVRALSGLADGGLTVARLVLGPPD